MDKSDLDEHVHCPHVRNIGSNYRIIETPLCNHTQFPSIGRTYKTNTHETRDTTLDHDNLCLSFHRFYDISEEPGEAQTQFNTNTSMTRRTNSQESQKKPNEDDNGIDEMTPVKNCTEAKSSRSLTEKPYKTNKRRNHEFLEENNDVEREDGTKIERTYKRNSHEIQEIHYQDHKGRYGMNTTKNRTDHKSREEEFEDYHEWVTLDENNEDKPHSYTSLQAEIIEEDAKTVASSINYYNPHEASTGIIETVHPITSTPKHIKKGDGGEYELKHYHTMKKRIIDIDDNINPEEDDQENIPSIAEDFRMSNKFPKPDEGGLRNTVNMENIIRKTSAAKDDSSLYGRLSVNESSYLYTKSLKHTNNVSKHITDLDNSKRAITATKDPEQGHLSNHSTQGHTRQPKTQTMNERGKQSGGQDMSTAKSNYVIHTEEESSSSARAPQLPVEHKGNMYPRNYISMTKTLNELPQISDRPPLNYGIKTCVPYKVWYADKCRTLLECETCSKESTAKILRNCGGYRHTLRQLEDSCKKEQTEGRTRNDYEYFTDKRTTECNRSTGCRCGFCRHHYNNWMEAGQNQNPSGVVNGRTNNSLRRSTLQSDNSQRNSVDKNCPKNKPDVKNNQRKSSSENSPTKVFQSQSSISSNELMNKISELEDKDLFADYVNSTYNANEGNPENSDHLSEDPSPMHEPVNGRKQKNKNTKDEKGNTGTRRLRVKNYNWYIKISWGKEDLEPPPQTASSSRRSRKSNKSGNFGRKRDSSKDMSQATIPESDKVDGLSDSQENSQLDSEEDVRVSASPHQEGSELTIEQFEKETEIEKATNEERSSEESVKENEIEEKTNKKKPCPPRESGSLKEKSNSKPERDEKESRPLRQRSKVETRKEEESKIKAEIDEKKSCPLKQRMKESKGRADEIERDSWSPRQSERMKSLKENKSKADEIERESWSPRQSERMKSLKESKSKAERNDRDSWSPRQSGRLESLKEVKSKAVRSDKDSWSPRQSGRMESLKDSKSKAVRGDRDSCSPRQSGRIESLKESKSKADRGFAGQNISMEMAKDNKKNTNSRIGPPVPVPKDECEKPSEDLCVAARYTFELTDDTESEDEPPRVLLKKYVCKEKEPDPCDPNASPKFSCLSYVEDEVCKERVDKKKRMKYVSINKINVNNPEEKTCCKSKSEIKDPIIYIEKSKDECKEDNYCSGIGEAEINIGKLAK